MPWYLKMPAKIVLARLPVPAPAFRRLGVFRAGDMDDPAYARSVFERHLGPWRDQLPAGFVALELGPGDSLLSAAMAAEAGASRCYLVDIEAIARTAHASPHAIADYLTDGLASLRSIPDESVDFVWSHAVLEHVARADFGATLRELRRVQKPDGIASHVIDLRDHLDGSLNNLRFPTRLWESRLIRHSGFYTNRLRFSELLGAFRTAGFVVDVGRVDRWDRPPLTSSRLAREFRSLPTDDLLVSGFEVVLRR